MDKATQRLFDRLAKSPYMMRVSEDDYKQMIKDEDFNNKVVDIRDMFPNSPSDKMLEFLEKKRNQTELQEQFNDLGGFIFSIYQRLGLMFDDAILSQEDKSKILLLSTYMGYDNKLRFKNNNPILKSHLPIVLRVSDRNLRSFITKITDLRILIVENKELYLNENLFVKGKIKGNSQAEDEDFGYTRIFVNTYQYLYENIPKSRLKYLGIIYNLLGYINFYHNVLVTENASETDVDKIVPMSFDELCKLCGYKDNSTRQAKHGLKKNLLSIELKNGTPLFAMVESKNGNKILINPHIVYSSSSIDTWNSTLEIIFKSTNRR